MTLSEEAITNLEKKIQKLEDKVKRIESRIGFNPPQQMQVKTNEQPTASK
ncbi:MAG: hypothetical protein KGI08_05425 [Thaumarchaeota archaeon]|nr:hypothetical protein [Nitrososphaerota archaeon]MDE1867133.1 hypothetical protein [Nitrososphaerota archaeon]